MDIPNLSQNPQVPVSTPIVPKKSNNSKTIIFIIVVLGVVSGFWTSRFWPATKSGNSIVDTVTQKDVTSLDNVKDQSNLEIGKYYGDTAKSFKDTATGTIEKGSINGEGTHILNREGGKSQRASLTLSLIHISEPTRHG